VDCLFCKIIEGKIPCQKIYENNSVLVLNDLNPQAPQHVLIIPKVHKDNVLYFSQDDGKLLVDIFQAIQFVAEKLNLTPDGFRVVVNTGENGGQTVNHIHFHLLGGRPLSWPPG
jgi:histidine triad (HIT) family protein